ncbi:L-rhamnose mutarotase [Agromyces ramosus]|uniref:L-rhamnose mutarotase n=1 Tax=Agromyces ramosus TaxID=33879 RepID=A0ABU0RAA6_9MICO|nr:L-rhamnose mutarotase [Agromyces ramosus]MDQ0894702.1 L-rhamnose mutarotase [Agromyces ramosus]
MHVRAIRTRLKAGMQEAYEEAHRVVPAEVAENLAERGYVEWLIFRHGQDLFHVITTTGDEPPRSERTQEIGERWHAIMGPHLEPVEGDVGSVDLRLVWSLSENGGA